MTQMVVYMLPSS